jgi:hypothetical protein
MTETESVKSEGFGPVAPFARKEVPKIAPTARRNPKLNARAEAR